jgi:hypothetical protein
LWLEIHHLSLQTQISLHRYIGETYIAEIEESQSLPHDWTLCRYAHRRGRPAYLPVACPDYRASNRHHLHIGSRVAPSCMRGLTCRNRCTRSAFARACATSTRRARARSASLICALPFPAPTRGHRRAIHRHPCDGTVHSAPHGPAAVPVPESAHPCRRAHLHSSST